MRRRRARDAGALVARDIYLSSLRIRLHAVHGLLDRFVCYRRAAEITLATAALVAVEVRLTALRTQDLPRCRHFHALGGALLRFHFRHSIYPFRSLPVGQSVLSPLQTENDGYNTKIRRQSQP